MIDVRIPLTGTTLTFKSHQFRLHSQLMIFAKTLRRLLLALSLQVLLKVQLWIIDLINQESGIVQSTTVAQSKLGFVLAESPSTLTSERATKSDEISLRVHSS